MTGGNKKGSKGVVLNLTLPRPIVERIDARAEVCYSRRIEYIRRFIIDNIDTMCPVEDTES